jgi:hypothetical protein
MLLASLDQTVVSTALPTITGRYRVFPIAGTALMTAGLYLLSLMGPGSPAWQDSLSMLVLGIGLGSVMQVLITIARQLHGTRTPAGFANRVPRRGPGRRRRLRRHLVHPAARAQDVAQRDRLGPAVALHAGRTAEPRSRVKAAGRGRAGVMPSACRRAFSPGSRNEETPRHRRSRRAARPRDADPFG